MKDINRLIVKAKKLYKPKKEFLIFGTIEHEKGKWNLNCMLWDGVPGSGVRNVISEHQSYDEAEKEAYRIAEEYPNYGEVKILLLDFEEEKHEKH